MNIQDYKNVFVFAEQRNGVIQPVAFELLGKARDLADSLGEKVVAMLLGYNVKDQAQKLIEMGADEVLVADCPELKDYITEQYSQAAYQIITEFKPTIVLLDRLFCYYNKANRTKSKRFAFGVLGFPFFV